MLGIRGLSDDVYGLSELVELARGGLALGEDAKEAGGVGNDGLASRTARWDRKCTKMPAYCQLAVTMIVKFHGRG